MERSILFLATGLDRGGAETQLARVARGLHERGWRVRVASLLPPGEVGEELTAAGLEVSGLLRPGDRPWRAALPLFRLLRQTRPLVLATFMYHANVFGRLWGRAAGVPVIVSSIRNVEFGGRLRVITEGLTARLDSATTTNSERVARALEQHVVFRGFDLKVIPNAVALNGYEMDPDARSRVRRTEGAGDAFVWLAVGHLYEQKDYPTLLNAFARLPDGPGEARLWIAGDGPESAPLHQLARDLHLENKVRFLGFRTEVVELLAAADAVVLSSAWEGSPNAVLEALAAARPVVATDVGGVRELVEHGQSGYLVPCGNPAALASAMSRLAALSPEERTAMGVRGRTAVFHRHELEAVITEWESLFIDRLRAVRRLE